MKRKAANTIPRELKRWKANHIAPYLNSVYPQISEKFEEQNIDGKMLLRLNAQESLFKGDEQLAETRNEMARDAIEDLTHPLFPVFYAANNSSCSVNLGQLDDLMRTHVFRFSDFEHGSKAARFVAQHQWACPPGKSVGQIFSQKVPCEWAGQEIEFKELREQLHETLKEAKLRDESSRVSKDIIMTMCLLRMVAWVIAGVFLLVCVQMRIEQHDIAFIFLSSAFLAWVAFEHDSRYIKSKADEYMDDETMYNEPLKRLPCFYGNAVIDALLGLVTAVGLVLESRCDHSPPCDLTNKSRALLMYLAPYAYIIGKYKYYPDHGHLGIHFIDTLLDYRGIRY